MDPIKDTHKWADYVELRCLTSRDRSVTIGDVAAWFRVDPQDAPPDDASESSNISQVQDEWGPGSERLTGDASEGANAAERVDNRQRLAEDVFLLLSTRAAAYGETYPFLVSEDLKQVGCKDDLVPGARLYVYLLLCANGRYVVRHQALTASFERLCAVAMRSMLPNADVHVFGTAGDGTGRYDRGTFKDKAARLASDLGEAPGPLVASIDGSETADRGLDFVGWVGVGDDLPSRLVVFGQAACTDNWVVKQDSPAPDAWDQIILVTCPQVVVCCIPHCFRNVAGGWHDQLKIHRRLLVDRRRLVHLLGSAAGFSIDDDLVDEFLGHRMLA